MSAGEAIHTARRNPAEPHHLDWLRRPWALRAALLILVVLPVAGVVLVLLSSVGGGLARLGAVVGPPLFAAYVAVYVLAAVAAPRIRVFPLAVLLLVLVMPLSVVTAVPVGRVALAAAMALQSVGFGVVARRLGGRAVAIGWYVFALLSVPSTFAVRWVAVTLGPLRFVVSAAAYILVVMTWVLVRRIPASPTTRRGAPPTWKRWFVTERRVGASRDDARH